MGRMVLAAGTAVLLWGVVSMARASVLCQKKSGAVFVRNTCKKKETLLDVSALGLVGPRGQQGIQGPKGDPGAPATAFWVRVHFDGTVESASSTQISVSHSIPGIYDVTFPQDVSSCAPLVSVHDTIQLLGTPLLNSVSSTAIVEVGVRNVSPGGPAGYFDADFSLALTCP
jgi:hypothetical protein